MWLFPKVTPVFLDSILTMLAPLFLTSAGDDLDVARHAAASMLASYDVETEAEIRLAAEIASRGFGVLDTLRRSMDPDLSISAVLRLRGSANAQHRSVHQCQQELDRLRTQRQTGACNPQPAAAEPVPQATAREPLAQDIAAEPSSQDIAAKPMSQDIAAGPRLIPATPAQPPVIIAPACLSRQQRRAMQRGMEKQQRRQAEQARREEMRAMRPDAKHTAPATPSGQASAA